MSDDRRSVKTYVPATQKDMWQEHADQLDMSQSEFLRTMVQAGRRGFTTPEMNVTEETSSPRVDPRGSDLETRIERALARGPCTWEELVEVVVGDVEDRLERTLDTLQDQNRVRYSGRDGGYVLTNE
jgi:hypothetical protein